MKKILRVEMRRAFASKGIKASFFIGVLLSVVHVFHNLGTPIESMKHIDMFLEKAIIYPIHVFTTWICGNTYNLEGFLYFMILPVLAVLPYADSYYRDQNSGFLINIYARCSRRDYLLAKYAAVFVSAGTVFVLPLILNLVIVSTLLPSLKPQVIAGGGIYTVHLWYQLYAEHPYVYVLLYLVIDFIFAGLTACLSLMVSFYTEKRLIVLLAPFVLHVFIYSVCSMIGGAYSMGYAPTYFLMAGFGCVSGWIFPVYFLVYLAAGGWYLLKGCRDDIF